LAKNIVGYLELNAKGGFRGEFFRVDKESKVESLGGNHNFSLRGIARLVTAEHPEQWPYLVHPTA
jgi:hypothetical protein